MEATIHSLPHPEVRLMFVPARQGQRGKLGPWELAVFRNLICSTHGAESAAGEHSGQLPAWCALFSGGLLGTSSPFLAAQ